MITALDAIAVLALGTPSGALGAEGREAAARKAPVLGGSLERTSQESANMFIAYSVALALVHELRDLVPIIKRHDRDLADQLHRAATSVALNLNEGQRSGGGNQHRHYTIAHGSANEVKAALDVAEAWGYVVDASAPRRTLDRLLALLWRLTHPRVEHHAEKTRA